MAENMRRDNTARLFSGNVLGKSGSRGPAKPTKESSRFPPDDASRSCWSRGGWCYPNRHLDRGRSLLGQTLLIVFGLWIMELIACNWVSSDSVTIPTSRSPKTGRHVTTANPFAEAPSISSKPLILGV